MAVQAASAEAFARRTPRSPPQTTPTRALEASSGGREHAGALCAFLPYAGHSVEHGRSIPPQSPRASSSPFTGTSAVFVRGVRSGHGRPAPVRARPPGQFRGVSSAATRQGDDMATHIPGRQPEDASGRTRAVMAPGLCWPPNRWSAAVAAAACCWAMGGVRRGYETVVSLPRELERQRRPRPDALRFCSIAIRAATKAPCSTCAKTRTRTPGQVTWPSRRITVPRTGRTSGCCSLLALPGRRGADPSRPSWMPMRWETA